MSGQTRKRGFYAYPPTMLLHGCGLMHADVAAAAGVSARTVSRALTGESTGERDRVLAAIATLAGQDAADRIGAAIPDERARS